MRLENVAGSKGTTREVDKPGPRPLPQPPPVLQSGPARCRQARPRTTHSGRRPTSPGPSTAPGTRAWSGSRLRRAPRFQGPRRPRRVGACGAGPSDVPGALRFPSPGDPGSHPELSRDATHSWGHRATDRASSILAALCPRGLPSGPPPPARARASQGRTYLRMLWASMLRFWLLEQTTATRSGDDGMAAAAPSALSGSGLPPSRGSSARARWRPRLPEVMTRSGGAADVSRRDARRGRTRSGPEASPPSQSPGGGRRKAQPAGVELPGALRPRAYAA